MSSEQEAPFQHVGIIGAGIGGLACAIAIRRHSAGGLRVTLLEAAAELGEIGAGIQMTPNVARLLVRWGVADEIGANLVRYERFNLRASHDGRVVGRSEAPGGGGPERWAGAPWWLVHRMHLHDGLLRVAEKEGVEVVTGARIVEIDHHHHHHHHHHHDDGDDEKTKTKTRKKQQQQKVGVRDETGRTWTFDLVIGADGVNSVTRRTILPDVTPQPPTNMAAYRALVPMEYLKADPLTRGLVERPEINVWMGAAEGQEHGYVIAYPISGGRVFNMVLTHHRSYPITTVEDVPRDEVRRTFAGYDPRLRRIIDLIPPEQEVRRWPLLVTRCPDTWASPERTVLLMGDAAHAMVNHLAQGAATAMEDGAFLGVLLREVHRGRVGLARAVAAYEAERMPLVDRKQQVSFVMGLVYHMEDGSEAQRARDEWMAAELRGAQLIRTPNMNADPRVWETIFGYDPEAHAEKAVEALLTGAELRNAQTGVTRDVADAYMNYWLPPGNLRVKSLL